MCFFQHFANANQTHDENATGSGWFSHWFVLLEVTRAMQACKSTFYQTVIKLFMRRTIEVYMFFLEVRHTGVLEMFWYVFT